MQRFDKEVYRYGRISFSHFGHAGLAGFEHLGKLRLGQLFFFSGLRQALAERQLELDVFGRLLVQSEEIIDGADLDSFFSKAFLFLASISIFPPSLMAAS